MFEGINKLLNDKEHMTEQANNGNTAAMRILSSIYRDEGNFNQAIAWAQKAISSGDSEALGLAALLLYERLLINAKQMPNSANQVLEDSKSFIDILPRFAKALEMRQIKNENNLSNFILHSAAHVYFIYSFMLYCGDKGQPIDLEKAIDMIKDVPGTRSKLLLGAEMAEKGLHSEAMPILEAGLSDSEYRNSEKDFMENMTYQTAILYASIIAREKGNLEKAVSILSNNISGIKDTDMRLDMQQELNKYQKKMLGGWKYIG